MKLDCGCVVVYIGNPDIHGHGITFCPLHAAAGEMLEALEFDAMAIKYTPALAQRYEKLAALIAKAKGEK